MLSRHVKMLGLAGLLFIGACGDADRHYDSAVAAFESDDFRGSVRYFTDAIDSRKLDDERLARAYKFRGISYLFIGLPVYAAADLERAIELDPSDIDLRHARAAALIRIQDVAGALTEMERAVELNPEDSLAYSNRCDILRLLQRYDAAIADCDKAIQLDGNFSLPWMERAKLYWDLGDEIEARASIREAQRRSPDHPRIRQLAHEYGALD